MHIFIVNFEKVGYNAWDTIIHNASSPIGFSIGLSLYSGLFKLTTDVSPFYEQFTMFTTIVIIHRLLSIHIIHKFEVNCHPVDHY